MSKIPEKIINKQIQKGDAGNDLTQAGRDFVQTSNSNNQIILSIVVIVALGGLAMTAYLAKDDLFNQPQPENTQIQS